MSFGIELAARASDEATTTTAYDTFKVQVRNTSGAVLATLATCLNLNKGSSCVQRAFDLSSYKGQAVVLHFEASKARNWRHRS